MDNKKCFTIFELYSGIGGFHFALKELFQEFKLNDYHLMAIDINTTANQMYRLNHCDNFGSNIKLFERNIQSLQAKDFENVDLLTMSPPCQPFSRLGNQLDLEDKRCDSFRYLMEKILPQMIQDNCRLPRYIMMENVKGFETSDAHDLMIETLIKCNYRFKEFLLTPEQFMVPNSRLRYYLLAKHYDKQQKQESISEICMKIPVLQQNSLFNSDDNNNNGNDSIKYYERIWFDSKTGNIQPEPDQLKHSILFENIRLKKFLNLTETDENYKDFYLSDDLLLRYHQIIDLVDYESISTNCFTKSYGHRLEGCGSILKTSKQYSIDEIYEQISVLKQQENKDEEIIIKLLQKLKLRFFTPEEIARLMSYPIDKIKFPKTFNKKQCYRLLGNSVNILVIHYLLRLLLFEELLLLKH